MTVKMKSLSKMNYIELVILCKQRGISWSGSKRDLAQRVRAHQQITYPPQPKQNLELKTETSNDTDGPAPKYPPLGPLENPKRILSRLEKEDLEEIMEQNDTNMASTTSIQWKCFDTQKKYHERALAANEKRCQALRKLTMEFDAIQESYVDDIEAIEKDMKAEMSVFGHDAFLFAEKQRNWNWAYEELRSREAAASKATIAAPEIPRSRPGCATNQPAHNNQVSPESTPGYFSAPPFLPPLPSPRLSFTPNSIPNSRFGVTSHSNQSFTTSPTPSTKSADQGQGKK